MRGTKNVASAGAVVHASDGVMTKLLPGGPVSVGWAPVAFCQTDTLVELLRADGGNFVNVRDPSPYISLPHCLLGGRHRGVDRAHVREVNQCVYGLNLS